MQLLAMGPLLLLVPEPVTVEVGPEVTWVTVMWMHLAAVKAPLLLHMASRS